jgi:hypothetical protein
MGSGKGPQPEAHNANGDGVRPRFDQGWPGAGWLRRISSPPYLIIYLSIAFSAAE